MADDTQKPPDDKAEAQQQQTEKPDDENTTDTNAGPDALEGTVADQPDDPEEAK